MQPLSFRSLGSAPVTDLNAVPYGVSQAGHVALAVGLTTPGDSCRRTSRTALHHEHGTDGLRREEGPIERPLSSARVDDEGLIVGNVIDGSTFRAVSYEPGDPAVIKL